MPGVYDRSKKSAITRSISPSYSNAISTYFGKITPDYNMAKGSHDAYVAALEAHGTDVTILPPLSEYPDSCFVEDTAVMIDEKVVISNMGHPSREGEEIAVLEHLSDDYEIIRMPKTCKLDGGDVVFYDDCFLIGLSTRTNLEGANFLKEEIKEFGYDVKYINIPKSTLHLTTVCSTPRPGTMIMAEGHLNFDEFDFVEEIIKIPNSESYASNVLGYSGDKVILANDFPLTRRKLLDHDFSITSVDMSAIMQADGSLTCLSVFVK
jgi:dimethylargininase